MLTYLLVLGCVGILQAVDFTARTEVYDPPSNKPASVLVLRMEFSDLPFTTADKSVTFSDQNSFYQETEGVFGRFLAANTRDAVAFGVVVLEETILHSSFSYAELLASPELAQATDAAERAKLHTYAVVNEMASLLFQRDGQQVDVFDAWSFHIPDGAEYKAMNVSSKGVLFSGLTSLSWRTYSIGWGLNFGLRTGGLLRPAVGASRWATIPRGDSFSGLAESPVAVDPLGHWPAHEKARIGWWTLGQEYQTVTQTGLYRLFAHNTANFTSSTSSSGSGPDAYLGLQLGAYAQTWWVSYHNDATTLTPGATLYLITGDTTLPYVLYDATPSTDACPNCPLGMSPGGSACPICDPSAIMTTTVTSTTDLGYASVTLVGTGGTVPEDMYIDVQVTFSTTEKCPLPGHYGALCDQVCAGPTDRPCEGQGTCMTGPLVSTSECVCGHAFGGTSCGRDDYCDVNMIGSPLAGYNEPSFMTNQESSAVASDFSLVNRQGNLASVRVMGFFRGVFPFVPTVVRVIVYTDNAGQPGDIVVSSSVRDGVDSAVVTVTPPTFLGSAELAIRIGAGHPLAVPTLISGTYWVSVVPELDVGQGWLAEGRLGITGEPDRIALPGGGWSTNGRDARVSLDFQSGTCNQWFAPKSGMSVLVMRFAFAEDVGMADTLQSTSSVVDIVGPQGTIAAFLQQSTQGRYTLDGTTSDAMRFLITDFVVTDVSRSVIPASPTESDRVALFQALETRGLEIVRTLGIDPDPFDIHFGFFGLAGTPLDVTKTLRPYSSVKAIWSLGVMAPTNAYLHGLATLAGFTSSSLMQDRSVGSMVDQLHIPNGFALDVTAYSWLTTSTLPLFNVVDMQRSSLQWLTTASGGILELDRQQGGGRHRIYAQNTAAAGSLKAIHLTEPTALYGWWLQYSDTTALIPGVTVLFEDSDGRVLYVDATPLTDNCMGCQTLPASLNLSDPCLLCNVDDTTLVPGAPTLDLGYVTLTTVASGADGSGKWLDVQIDFGSEGCPLPGHFGPQCMTQCPGGSVAACGAVGVCWTGPTGNGSCGCSDGRSGIGCNADDVCDTSRFFQELPASFPNGDLTGADVLVPSYITASGYQKGPVTDIETANPAHISGVTVFGRANHCCPNGGRRVTSPVGVTVIVYEDDNANPGQVWQQTTVGQDNLVVHPGSLLSSINRLEVRFPMHAELRRHALQPGRYWLQVLLHNGDGDGGWSLLMAQQPGGNGPDLYRDTTQSMTWVTASSTITPAIAFLELKIEVNFDRCKPVYRHPGIPLPQVIANPMREPTAMRHTWWDYWPTMVNTDEDVDVHFRGWLAYGGKFKAKVADFDQGFGCIGEVEGGEAREVGPLLTTQFKASKPGLYSVCIQVEDDLDWEEAEELLYVQPVGRQGNFFGFSNCESLTRANSTICGCQYEQPASPGGAQQQDIIVLPMDFPFHGVTSGLDGVRVRQGCCVRATRTVEEFPYTNVDGNITDMRWMTCVDVTA